MTISQIQYFVSVADNLNFTRAAEQFFISQTAVSKQIQLLEEELGAKLFLRNNRSVEITLAGKIFYGEAIKILDLLHRAGDKVKRSSVNKQTTLDIVLTPRLENEQFMDKIYQFSELHPEITFSFHHCPSSENAYELLSARKADLALVLEIRQEDISWLKRRRLMESQHYVVVRKDSRFSQYEYLTREQLVGEPFYMTKVPPDELEKIKLDQDPFDRIPQVYIEDDIESLLLRISFSGGYTILIEPLLQNIPANKHLSFIPLMNEYVPINMLWNEAFDNDILRELIDYISPEH